MFDRTDMKINLYRVVFRVEFDGDVRFFLAPPKSMFVSIFIEFSMFFLQFFRFPNFRKNLDFFFVPPPSRSLCRRGRGRCRGDFTS